MRTNNLVTVSFAEALLKEQEVDYFVADQNMSIMDGSLGILPRRIMVDSEKLEQARALMRDAGLGAELPAKPIRAGS